MEEKRLEKLEDNMLDIMQFRARTEEKLSSMEKAFTKLADEIIPSFISKMENRIEAINNKAENIDNKTKVDWSKWIERVIIGVLIAYLALKFGIKI